jgi:simple sugar transport system permease protein
LDKIPVLGGGAFQQHLLVYVSVIFVVVLAWVFRSTTVGLNLHAAGEKPEALDAAGVSVKATRSYAVLATGALAGIGGAFLSIVGAGVFTPFMTQGQGYMAIVICMLARGKPVWALAASLLFGISLSVTTALQLAGINISTDVINMLPFIAIMVALVIFGRRSYLPPVLALPYVRGAR